MDAKRVTPCRVRAYLWDCNSILNHRQDLVKSISRLLVVLSIFAGPLAAQATPKRALTQADWDSWR